MRKCRKKSFERIPGGIRRAIYLKFLGNINEETYPGLDPGCPREIPKRITEKMST